MNTVKYVLFAALCAICVTAIFTQPAAAQATISYAQLNGTVRDASERILVGAEIALRNKGTNRTYETTSNDNGLYVLVNLPPGPYELSISYSGFSDFVNDIDLSVGQTATINVTMSVAGTSEEVTVTAAAPIIEPSRTELSQVIDTEQIADLPVSGRLFTDFALLTPGAAVGRTSLGTVVTEFEVTQISFGGMRSFSNMVSVDGADFINSISGVQRATPPQESISEFTVPSITICKTAPLMHELFCSRKG